MLAGTSAGMDIWRLGQLKVSKPCPLSQWAVVPEIIYPRNLQISASYPPRLLFRQTSQTVRYPEIKVGQLMAWRNEGSDNWRFRRDKKQAPNKISWSNTNRILPNQIGIFAVWDNWRTTVITNFMTTAGFSQNRRIKNSIPLKNAKQFHQKIAVGTTAFWDIWRDPPRRKGSFGRGLAYLVDVFPKVLVPCRT